MIKKKRLIQLGGSGLALLGMILFAVALLAYQLHIDNNPAMGANRTALAWAGGLIFLVGVAILLIPLFRKIIPPSVAHRLEQWFSFIQKPYSWLVATRAETRVDERRHSTGWYAGIGALIAAFLCVGYITSGRFVTWTPSTVFFDRQANAFLAGQLALLEKPPAALATLQNPYLVANREGVSGYFWDASYYQGKYYYYWGPVSGLVAAGIKLFNHDWVIQDQYLVVLAVIGLVFVQAALIHRLQKRYFPHLGGWMVLGLTLLSGLNAPVFWLINNPVVHEVPISLGQFFLLIGIYAAFRGMESEKSRITWLALAGLSWGASIGSRLTLIFGIGWMVLLLGLFIFFKSSGRKTFTRTLIALLVPLIMWGAGLAWYNYARFGNILETGHRYQLTGNGLPANYRDIVSVSYVLPNLYNLLARPFQIHRHEFPFFFTPWISNTMWPWLIFFPRSLTYFFGEPIAGLFPGVPSAWLVLAGLVFLPVRALKRTWESRPPLRQVMTEAASTTWLAWMAFGAILLNLAFLSIYIFSSMRYLADLTPLLVLLLTLGLGRASNTLHSRPRLWMVIRLLTGLSIVASIVISLLTNFQNGNWLFKNGNPALYHAIERFFTGG